jgi:hypothetical protein
LWELDGAQDRNRTSDTVIFSDDAPPLLITPAYAQTSVCQ